MSATLGDVSRFEKDLSRRTGRATAVVSSAERPVPLLYSYVITPLHETLEELLATRQAPVYVVHFTQAAALEQAQALMSVNVCSRAQKDEIAAAIGNFRFTAGFGKTLSRLVRHGIGVHHAGMLPRYRRLVETLAQAGLLKVICGTDTLGVGINVPIRTVLFTAPVQVRRQDDPAAAGAGVPPDRRPRRPRPGSTPRATWSCRRPSMWWRTRRLWPRPATTRRSGARWCARAAEGFVSWSQPTFERLVAAEPEPLKSSFMVSHAMVLGVIDRPGRRVRRHAPPAHRQRRGPAGPAAAHPATPSRSTGHCSPRVWWNACPGPTSRAAGSGSRSTCRRISPSTSRCRRSRWPPSSCWTPATPSLPAGCRVGHRGHPGEPAPGARGPAEQGARRGRRAR